jgi:oligopeptide/dipeptide ABC transporter ATP-binding protein
MTDRDTLYRQPLHPYTEALLSAIPVPDPDRPKNRKILTGEIPSPLNPPAGCHFHPRCPIAAEGICDIEVPQLRPAGDNGDHLASCHLRTGEHQELNRQTF